MCLRASALQLSTVATLNRVNKERANVLKCSSDRVPKKLTPCARIHNHNMTMIVIMMMVFTMNTAQTQMHRAKLMTLSDMSFLVFVTPRFPFPPLHLSYCPCEPRLDGIDTHPLPPSELSCSLPVFHSLPPFSPPFSPIPFQLYLLSIPLPSPSSPPPPPPPPPPLRTPHPYSLSACAWVALSCNLQRWRRSS